MSDHLPVPLPPLRPPPAARLANWTPWPLPNAALFGHADVTFAGGWRINATPIFLRGDGSFSAGAPSAPQIDRAGRQRTDPAGKKLYTPLLQFETAEARERWNTTILRALADAGITPPQAALEGVR